MSSLLLFFIVVGGMVLLVVVVQCYITALSYETRDRVELILYFLVPIGAIIILIRRRWIDLGKKGEA